MLIRRVPSGRDASRLLAPAKRGSRAVGPPSPTRLGWFSLAAIDQYSSLLPPVGVWTVSQFQCGGPPSRDPWASSAWWAVAPPTT